MMSDGLWWSNVGGWASEIDWRRDMDLALAAIQKPGTPEARFVDLAARFGVVAGHPTTIAALDARSPMWRAELGVRAVSLAWLREGHLYTGEVIAAVVALDEPRQREVSEPTRQLPDLVELRGVSPDGGNRDEQ